MSDKFADRRNFLVASSAAIALSTMPGLVRAAGRSTRNRWEVLGRIAGGRLIRPGSARYEKAALPNNLRFRNVRPQGIVYVTSPQMVAEVINWCRDYDMPFVVRGGGHSYAGYSSTHDLVIDMREMRSAVFDAASGDVTIGAGVLNGQVYSALSRAGRIITHGRCPSVGAAGFLLGGGIGFNMRRFGMGCDAVLRSQIVTADGKIRALSSDSDPDLFWAIRGGAGGNFGVSTQFTLKTQPVDRLITVFRSVWRANTLEVAKALFAATEAAPVTLGTRISLGGITPSQGRRERQVPVTLLGQYAGSREDMMAILAPVFAVAQPESSEIKEVAYWEGQNFLLDPGAPAYFRERSAFLRKAPDAEFLGKAFETLERWTGTGAHGDLFFFQTGGKINEIASDATAFVHRDSRWLSVVGISWSEDDAANPEVVRRASDWQDGLYDQVNRLGGTGAFQNFPDSALVDWRARYYGTNHDRLLRIKQQEDPTNVFQFMQSI
jgi:FAD/FMN-containing dehydrogenase